jgi:hypothetical protein
MHIPFNDFDMAAVTNKITDYKKDDLKADFDITRSEQGIVSVAVENWRDRDGSFIIFEIHKVGKKRFMGHRVSWIVQLYSKKTRDSEPVKHGCSTGDKQVDAIFEAELDAMHGFLSICDFELAYSAAIE